MKTAVREALSNSLVHREYSLRASTLISLYADRIEFTSIGGLVSGVTLAEIPITFFYDAVKAPDTRRDPADDKSSALPSGRAPAPSIPGSRRALTLLCLVLDHFNDHRLLLETGKALDLLAVL